MIRAHFTLPCLYHAQEKIVDLLNIPSLVMSEINSTGCYIAENVVRSSHKHSAQSRTGVFFFVQQEAPRQIKP